MVRALERRDPGEWLGFVQAADRQGSRCRNQTFAKLSANASRADGSFQRSPKRGPEKEPGTFALSAGQPLHPPKSKMRSSDLRRSGHTCHAIRSGAKNHKLTNWPIVRTGPMERTEVATLPISVR